MIKFDCSQIEQFSGINKLSLGQVLDFAWQVHVEGINIVIVSMEEKGTIIAYDKKIVQAIPPKIRAVNLFGSGDAFIAGFTVGILEKRVMSEVIKLAMACALTNAMSIVPGQVNHHDVKEFFDKVKIEKIR